MILWTLVHLSRKISNRSRPKENLNILEVYRYIYKYPKSYLKTYSDAVIKEMHKRGIAIRSMDKYDTYFAGVTASGNERFPEHNEDYYQICYWNLREKYLRGQKDFTKERFNALTVNFCLRDGCNHYKEICDEN